MVEFKPCPFCGQIPKLVTCDVEPQGDAWYGKKVETFVSCDCGCCLFDGAFHEGFYDAETRAAAAWNARAEHAEAARLRRIYAECRECNNCGHIGINDASDTGAACAACYWTGPSPAEDHCPECGRNGTMTTACPKCGERYHLIAEGTLPAEAAQRVPLTEAQVRRLYDNSPEAHGDVTSFAAFARLWRLFEAVDRTTATDPKGERDE